MQLINKYIKGDRVIWAVVMLLAIISVLVVYSSIVTLAYKYQGGNTEYYLFKHSIILFIGFLLMYFAHKVNYRYYSRMSQIGLLLAIPLLLFTLLTGASINDASRWLVIPIINQTFQTSDLAKLALIMFLARMLSKRQDNIKDFNQAFLPIMIPVLIVCGLILPANLSTAAMLFVTCLVLMFIGRINMKYIISLILVGITFLSIFIAIGLSIEETKTSETNSPLTNRVITWRNRIINFSDGSAQVNYQAEQSKIAIATGGVLGKGPGRSTQRNFLPQSYSDFIFATVIEEYGIVGGTFTLLLYLILLYRGILIAKNAPRTFGSLLAIEKCIFMSGPFPRLPGLTYDGSNLIGLGLGPVQPLFAIHPASGVVDTRGTTGFNWNVSGIDTDPTTGIVYATWGSQLYTIDTAGGHSDEAPRATLIAADIGVLPGDCICALGIDGNGIAYGFGIRQSGFSIYRVDLTGGPAIVLGVLQYPAPGMFMSDVAFDGNGDLWAFLWRQPGVHPEQGLYKIDLGAQTLTQHTSNPNEDYLGIAFVPAGPLVTYCTAKTNSLGCTPSISGDGFPSVTGTSGFSVACTDTRNNTAGFLVWGTRGPQTAPFFGGTLCVAPKLRRTPLVASGGSGYPVKDCTGVWELDFNSLLSNRQFAFLAGQQVNCQWMGRDAGFAPPNGVSLSNALEFVLGP